MSYRDLQKKQYYVDKTEVIERELERFPSIYIEGAAASGKTTAVRMLLSRRMDVLPEVFWMEQESKEPQLFMDKIKAVKVRMERSKRPVWVILENMPQNLSQEIKQVIIHLIETIPSHCRVLMLGREELEEEFVALLWERKMELLPQKVLLFLPGEIDAFAKEMGCFKKADEVYQITGGWAGCTDLLLRFYSKHLDASASSIKNIRNCYEVEHYIQKEILEQLDETEQMMLTYAKSAPWMNEEFCQETIGLKNARYWLQRMEKKGLLLFGPRKTRWKIAPLFRDEGAGKEKTTVIKTTEADIFQEELLLKIGTWYEEHNYIEEALLCLKQMGDKKAFQTCVVKHYQKVPFRYLLHMDVENWQGDACALCYLRGVHNYLHQDFTGLHKEMKIAAKLEGETAKEVHFNLTYLDPETSLEVWLNLLERYVKDGKRASLYHIIGESGSFLCGIRDLSGLFNGSKQQVKYRADLWKNGLSENRWIVYQLIEAEYNLEINIRDFRKENAINLILGIDAREERNTYQAKISLMGNMLQAFPDERIEEEMTRLKDILAWEWDWYRTKGIETLLMIQSLWFGKKDSLDWWKTALKHINRVDINEDNKMVWWYRTKACLYFNRYEQAEAILEAAIPYLRSYRRSSFLAEALFVMAVLKHRAGKKSECLRYIIESLIIANEYRYVRFYTRYGKLGKEVLETYVTWYQSTEPEKWNRKKKYNYGNVLRMPYFDYVQLLLRCAKKAQDEYRVSEPVEEMLTMMERIMLQAISLGMSNAEICEEQNLKLPTVKGHIYSLYKKLGVNSRVQAVRKAKELEILN